MGLAVFMSQDILKIKENSVFDSIVSWLRNSFPSLDALQQWSVKIFCEGLDGKYLEAGGCHSTKAAINCEWLELSKVVISKITGGTLL